MALEGEGTEDEAKGSASCRKMWHGMLHCHWRVALSEKDSLGTGFCIRVLPYFCSKPQPLDLASPHRPEDKERRCQRSACCVSPRSLWPRPHSKLPDTRRIKGPYVCASMTHSADSPTCSVRQRELETEIWLHWHPPHLVTKTFLPVRSSSQQVRVHSP